MGAKPGSHKSLPTDPLSADDILATGFYRTAPPKTTVPTSEVVREVVHDVPTTEVGQKKPRPTHYKIVCISLYLEDIERLETLVQKLKEKGLTKANKSLVIRAALEQIDLEKVPRFQ